MRFALKSALIALALSAILGAGHARAACTIPNTLTNGTTADATQVMGNFTAVAGCLTPPAGSTNSVQTNGGSGAFGSVGPLTNGQVLVGSTGAAPVATTLTGGPGISITNGSGAITLGSTNPFPIGPIDIGMGSGAPPITTYCPSTAAAGSGCFSSTTGLWWSEWTPPSATPARVQEVAKTGTFALTLGSAPTANDYLIAVGYMDGALPTVAAGWTSWSTHTGNIDLVVAYHKVVYGDGVAQTPFAGSAGCYGATIFEASGLDPVNFANSVQSTAYADGSTTATISTTTAQANTLGMTAAGSDRVGCNYGTGYPTPSAGWTNISQDGNYLGDPTSAMVASQLFPSSGSLATSTITVSSGGTPNFSSVMMLLKASVDPLTTGWQQMSYLTAWENGGTPITGTGGPRSVNCSTGLSCSADADGNVTMTTTGGGGTVTTTGSPAAGELTEFSGSSTITNGDLSGDCTTSGSLAVTCSKFNGGSPLGTFAGQNYAAPPAIGGTTPNSGAFTSMTVTSLTDTGAAPGSGYACLHVSSTGAVSNTGSDCGSGGGGGGVTSVGTIAPWTSGGPITSTGTIDLGKVVKASTSAAILSGFGGL